MAKIEQIRAAPVILQRIVPKMTELRITIVGDKIFPVAVLSDNEVDWRKSKITLESIDLPNNIEDLCFEYVSALGLRYGCVDMIISPDGDYYFLEINPNGQWGFVEQKTGLPIGKAIAHLLLGS